MTFRRPSNILSLFSIAFIVFLMLFMIRHYEKWRVRNNVIINDVIGYYGYLPATFIYHDFTLEFLSKIGPGQQCPMWYSTTPQGKRVLRMTMGMSLLYAPFFFAGHIYAQCKHYNCNGYTDPYQVALLISTLFYATIGLIFLRKLLLRYFSSYLTAFLILITGVGTNLFYYITIEGPYSHSCNFTLMVMFIYFTIRWYEKPCLKYAVTTGIVFGLLSLIRPTNAVILIFFVLYGLTDAGSFGNRLRIWRRHFPHLLLTGTLVALIWIPQLLYWKKMTGEWLFYSYGDEKILWSQPQILNGLFSFRKGWLLYTPLMVFSLAGLALSYRRLKAFFWPTLVFLIVNLYVVFSWWCWWYGGGLSQRALVDMYGLMAVMLGVFLQWLWTCRQWIKIPLTILVMLAAFMSTFYTIQYRNGALHWDSMSKAAYIENFGHSEPYGNYWNLVICPDYDKAKHGIQDTVPRH